MHQETIDWGKALSADVQEANKPSEMSNFQNKK